MLVVSKFLSYEKPEGHEPGLPEVYVRSSLAENNGLPEVDYHNLREMYTSRFGFDPEDLPVLRLYSKFINSDFKMNPKKLLRGIDEHGYRSGSTVHINVDHRIFDQAPQTAVNSHKIMESVVLHTAAFAASRDDKNRIKMRNILKRGAGPLGLMLLSALDQESPIGQIAYFGAPVFGAIEAGVGIRNRRANLRTDARRIKMSTFSDHHADIVWPFEYQNIQRELDK